MRLKKRKIRHDLKALRKMGGEWANLRRETGRYMSLSLNITVSLRAGQSLTRLMNRAGHAAVQTTHTERHCGGISLVLPQH